MSEVATSFEMPLIIRLGCPFSASLAVVVVFTASEIFTPGSEFLQNITTLLFETGRMDVIHVSSSLGLILEMILFLMRFDVTFG